MATTNWDRRVSDAMASAFPDAARELRHLHGDIRDCKTLLLPTESAREPYKNAAECRRLMTNLANLIDAIKGATRVVIYGLALGALDIELTNAISRGVDSSHLYEGRHFGSSPCEGCRPAESSAKRRKANDHWIRSDRLMVAYEIGHPMRHVVMATGQCVGEMPPTMTATNRGI
jgi:hypothetical protein